MSDFLGFDPDSDDVVDHAIVPHRKAATDRSSARRIALQALYEIDSAKHPIGDVLNYHHGTDQNRKVINYVVKLVTDVQKWYTELNDVLQDFASEFPLDQVAVVDRNILRIALYEMVLGDNIPVGVAIDEAIELSKLFGAENSPRFINGVLGAIADKLDDISPKFQVAVDISDE